MKLKKKLLSILSFAIIISITAFTLDSETSYGKGKVKKASKMVYSYYFVYNGPNPAFTFNNLINPNNYTYLASQDPVGLCRGSRLVCAILTERTWNGFEWKPDFSNTSYSSAYWGLYNYFISGIPATATVILKN